MCVAKSFCNSKVVKYGIDFVVSCGTFYILFAKIGIGFIILLMLTALILMTVVGFLGFIYCKRLFSKKKTKRRRKNKVMAVPTETPRD